LLIDLLTQCPRFRGSQELATRSDANFIIKRPIGASNPPPERAAVLSAPTSSTLDRRLDSRTVSSYPLWNGKVPTVIWNDTYLWRRTPAMVSMMLRRYRPPVPAVRTQDRRRKWRGRTFPSEAYVLIGAALGGLISIVTTFLISAGPSKAGEREIARGAQGCMLKELGARFQAVAMDFSAGGPFDVLPDMATRPRAT